MRTLTSTQIIRETLAAELHRDSRLFLMGEDIGAYGGSFGVTRGLVDEFGSERIRNTPISEPGFVGAAIGAAVAGSHPVVEIMFMDFITLAVDQLVNMAAKLHPIYGRSCPLVIRTPPGGGRGYGATHSQSLERLFAGIPGLKIAAPSNASDASALLQTAIRDNNPVLFLEHKLLYGVEGEVDDAVYEIPLGKGEIKREGTDVTVVATSLMVHKALEAAEKLAAEGISVEVVDPRCLVPLDKDIILNSVKKTHALVIAQEAVKTAGAGAEIAAMVAEEALDYLDAPIARVGAPYCPVPFSPPLEAAYIPSAEQIVAAVKGLR